MKATIARVALGTWFAVAVLLVLAACSQAVMGNGADGNGDGGAPGPNSCEYANDGECDEGTYCSVGTDTADCTMEDSVVAKINEAWTVHESVEATLNATDATAPLADRLRTVAERLTAMPTVTRATASDDTIELTHTSGLETVMLFLEEGSDRRGPGAAQPAAVRVATSDDSQAPVTAPVTPTRPTQTVANDTPLVVNEKVLICAPLDHNKREPKYAETGQTVANIFRNAPAEMPRFDVTYLPYEECTVEALLKVSSYGTIVFSGHGSHGKYLYLALKLDENHVKRYQSLIAEGSVRASEIYRNSPLGYRSLEGFQILITQKFFRKYLKPTGISDKGRVIVTPACTTTQQVDGGDLEDALSRVGVHVGYDGLVADHFADGTTQRFFASMMKGETATAAYNALPVKVNDGVNIQIYGTGAYRYGVSPGPPSTEETVPPVPHCLQTRPTTADEPLSGWQDVWTNTCDHKIVVGWCYTTRTPHGRPGNLCGGRGVGGLDNLEGLYYNGRKIIDEKGSRLGSVPADRRYFYTGGETYRYGVCKTTAHRGSSVFVDQNNGGGYLCLKP